MVDYKKLLTEKENLIKLVNNEKENTKRLAEENARVKAENDKLEVELAKLKENLEKNVREVVVINKNKYELEQVISSLKAQLAENQVRLDTLKNESESKEAVLQDLKNKEIQIRKIAKRYKDSFMELKKQIEDKRMDDLISIDEKENLSSIKSELTASIEENNVLKQQIEQLKLTLEKEERNKALLKEAKQRIIYLQTLNKDLQSAKLMKTPNQDLTTDQFESSYTIDSSSVDKSQQNVFQINKESDSSFQTKPSPNSSRQIALQSVKPMPATTSSEKSIQDALRTANIRPIAPSCQHSPTVTSWRGTETPLASIRPMTVQHSNYSGIIKSSFDN